MTQIVLVWVLFICAQLADVWTTNKVLAQGGREANPVAARMMDWFGGAWWVAKLAGAGLVGGALHYLSAHLIMLIVGILTGLVAANNYRQIK